MKNTLHFFIYSNLLIALAAVSSCCTTYCLAGATPLVDTLLLLIFSATLIGYVLPRVLSLQKMSRETQEKLGVPKQLLYLWILLIVALVSTIYLFCLQYFFIQCWLVLTGSLTFLYALPLIRWKQKWWRGRDIGLGKIFLIATVWSISTALIPLLQLQLTSGIPLPISEVIGLTMERWLFIFAITLPFDIRDQAYDLDHGLQTIPLLIGAKKTIRLAQTVLLSLLFFSLLYYNYTGFNEKNAISIGLALSYAICTYFVGYTKSTQPDAFYTGLLDSTIIMQFIFVAIPYFIL